MSGSVRQMRAGGARASATDRLLPEQRPLRVALVAPSLDIMGGQSVIAGRLLARLREIPGLDIVFVPHNPRLPGPLRLLQRVKYVRTVFTSIAYVASLVRQLRTVDVVHAFSASYWSFLLAPAPAVLIARALGRPVILNYHSGEAGDHLANWPRTGVPVMRRATVIVAPSGYLVDVFARFGLAARAIFNFVEPERQPYRRREQPGPRFLSNRNFHPMYNVSAVLRAFARIQAAVPDASLVVAGDGLQRRELHALAASLALRNVEFAGRVEPERMPALYDAADVYLNASDIDNMPSSIVEAFTAGLPVVTTNAGGIPYIVSHERTALMVERGDDRAIAASALRLLHEPGLALRLSDAARAESLDRYTWQAVGAQWVALYRELAGATVAAASVAGSPLDTSIAATHVG